MPKSRTSGKSGSKGKSARRSSSGGGTGGGVPKAVTATLDRIKARLDSLDSEVKGFVREFRTQAKAWTKMGEKSSAKRAKRKPSEYNLFLRDKMKQGQTMQEAVNSWKARGGSGSSMSSGASESMSTVESESETEEEEA